MTNDDDIDETAVVPAAPGKRRKWLPITGAAALALIAIGGGAYHFVGTRPAAAEETDSATSGGSAADDAPPLDVPPLLVNLRSPDGAAHFLKLHVMLVPGPGTTAATLKDALPVLLDAYQPFLRELRPEDLSGSAAVFRIKEELLVRARETIGAGKVQDVLIQDMVQQ